jgi:hypothetical protein
MSNTMKWVPFGLLLGGVLLLSGGVTQQKDVPLRMSLDEAVPTDMQGLVATTSRFPRTSSALPA